MQLLLAAILSGTALIVAFLAQPDWKPYSSPEGGFVVSLPDDAHTSTIVTETTAGRLFTHIVSASDSDLNEYMVSWTDYRRDVEDKAGEKTFNRMRDALIRQREGKLVSESPTMLAGRKGRAITFTDNAGYTVNVKFYFVGQRSFELLAESRSKESLAKADKFFASFNINVSELVKRELKKGLIDAERSECVEQREAKRQLQNEFVRSERAERAEPLERSERSQRAERGELLSQP